MQKILAVDDSASMRQMVSFTLQSSGYTVDTAVDGMDALSKVDAGGYDLILSDVNMPNMDGLEFVRQLRALPVGKFVPVLMLTTESGLDKKSEGKQAGATGWIVKPFNPEQLLKTVRKVLG